MVTILDDRQIKTYWEKGYVHIPQVFLPDEVAALQQECDRLMNTLIFEATPHVPLRQNEAGDWVCDRLDPALKFSACFQALVQDPRICQRIRVLLQDDPHLFKDKLILKPAGTSGYGLHQDYPYYSWTQIPADALLSVQISLDRTFAQNGSIIFYPGLHHQVLPAPEQKPLDVDPNAVKDIPQEMLTTDAGDILIFHSLAPHCSNANRTALPRRTLYLTYNAGRYGNRYTQYQQERTHALSLR